MTHVTRRLTAKNRDQQLRNPTLGNRVLAIFLQMSELTHLLNNQNVSFCVNHFNLVPVSD